MHDNTECNVVYASRIMKQEFSD